MSSEYIIHEKKRKSGYYITDKSRNCDSWVNAWRQLLDLNNDCSGTTDYAKRIHSAVNAL